MASVTKGKGGVTLQFVLASERRSIWLGKVTARDVGLWKRHVEELVSAVKIGRAVYDDTATWLANLDDQLYRKLSSPKIALVPPRESSAADSSAATSNGATLGPFLDGFLAKQTGLKRSTIVCLTQCRNDLVAHFGADKPLASVTEGDCEDWRHWLRAKRVAHPGRRKAAKARASKASYRDRDKPKQAPKRLMENTIRRRCGRARQLFQAAVRHRLIDRNPFAELRGVSVLANKSRDFYVTREEADKVSKALPDSQWKLLFALSRYAGLRCPSEHLALCWSDIDWQRGRIRVPAPKTAHIEGKGERLIPLFPELREPLRAVQAELGDSAKPDSPVITKYRSTNVNLRTQLLRFMAAAGVKKWPKLFANMRATRATELVAEGYRGHVVAAWMGHSETIARRHYLQVTDSDFDRASGIPPEPTPNRGFHLHQSMHLQAETKSKQVQRDPGHTGKRGKRDKCSPFASNRMAEAGVEPARGLPPNGF